MNSSLRRMKGQWRRMSNQPTLKTLKRSWDFRPLDCPCDVHFVEWMLQREEKGETIFHFGTGGHHYVGENLASDESGTSILGITATQREYESYIDLITRSPRLAHHYVVYLGDIYTSNTALLPSFNVVTLFHLCEFRTEANDAYGALTDAQLLELFTEKTEPGGHLVFYTGSYAYDKARPILDEWARQDAIEEVSPYKTLRIFRKLAR